MLIIIPLLIENEPEQTEASQPMRTSERETNSSLLYLITTFIWFLQMNWPQNFSKC